MGRGRATVSIADRCSCQSGDVGSAQRKRNQFRELIRRFALGAGIPPSAIQGRDAGALAEEMGLLVKFVASSLTQLLAARAETKRMARSANHTMIQPQENNPLKFAPTVEEALQLMFGAQTSGLPRCTTFLSGELSRS